MSTVPRLSTKQRSSYANLNFLSTHRPQSAQAPPGPTPRRLITSSLVFTYTYAWLESEYSMNQSIRDNPNKMMPVPYNLSETHQGFPTSSPCPRFSAAKNCDFRTRFGAPVSSAVQWHLVLQGGTNRVPCFAWGVHHLYIDTLVYSHHPAPLALLEVVQLVGKTIRVWWNYVPDTSRY